MIFLTVILMDILTGMEFDLFVPSFPQLQQHFALTPFWVEALLSVNFIGYCLSLLFVGVLADRYGRRLIIVSSLMIFILGSLLCLLIDAYPAFLFGRFLQGLGVAAPATLSFVIVADLYSLKEQQFFMAMLNGLMNIAVAVAPVAGSYITFYFHWQGNFVALLFLGLLALLMTFKFVPKAVAIEENLSAQGYRALFKSKALMLVMMCMVILCLPYWIFVGISPLIYIKDLGVSLQHFGYYQGVLALVFAVGCIGLGFLMKRRELNQLRLIYLNNVILMLSFIGLVWISLIDTHSPLLITVMMLIFVIGQIIPSVILYPKCLSLMPAAKGRISAFIQGMRLIFTALTLQVVGYVYTGSFQSVGIFIAIFVFFSVVMMFIIMAPSVLRFTD